MQPFKGNLEHAITTTILAFAREYAIKVIVVGKSQQPWYKRLWGSSILERLERHSEGIDILIADVNLPEPDKTLLKRTKKAMDEIVKR